MHVFSWIFPSFSFKRASALLGFYFYPHSVGKWQKLQTGCRLFGGYFSILFFQHVGNIVLNALEKMTSVQFITTASVWVLLGFYSCFYTSKSKGFFIFHCLSTSFINLIAGQEIIKCTMQILHVIYFRLFF